MNEQDLLNMTVNSAQSEPAGKHKPSVYQEAIYAATQMGSENLLIEAVAGSGKTTTIIEATDYCLSSVLFLAFNKSIAQDIQMKLPNGRAQTLNSLGHRLWMQNCPSARLDFDKIDKLLHHYLHEEHRKKFGYTISRLMSTAKANGVGLEYPVVPKDFESFIINGDWDIEDAVVGTVAEYCCQIFRASVDDRLTFDFDDQIYGPIRHGWTFPRFGTIMVDEAQDLNAIQHEFVARLAERGARIIAVGDRHQAIYGFRGALHDSLDLLRERFKMKELPLSISYRCPRSVIAEAQLLVPHIQAREGAPVGRVLHQRTEYFRKLDEEGRIGYGEESVPTEAMGAEDPEIFPDGWLIVCRNNAPLFSAVMKMVRAKKPCRVLSNALDGLSSFIKRLRPRDMNDLIFKVERWMEKEVLAAEAKGMPWKVAAIEDKAGTILLLCEGLDTPERVLALLRSLSESHSGPIFATIHKAKGLEAEHVYFLRPDLVPGWWIEKKEDLQQEMNLRYVAITRAKETLTYGISAARSRR